MHNTFFEYPKEVYKYLLVHTNYRLDYCLSICQHYDILDASTYLLERTGDVSGALTMILTRSNQNVTNLVALHPNSESLEQMKEEGKKLESTIKIAIVLCQRNSSSLPEEENKALWFRLLDSLVVPLRKLKTKKNRRGFRVETLDEKALLSNTAPPGMDIYKLNPKTPFIIFIY